MKKFLLQLLLLCGYLPVVAMESPRSQVSKSEFEVIKKTVVCCINFIRCTESNLLKYKSCLDSGKRCTDQINNSSCCYLCSCFQEKADEKN